MDKAGLKAKINWFPGYIRVKQSDNELIAELIMKAKGDRSLTEYAKACEVSTSTLSRIVNNKTTSPSTDKLIYRLAEHAAPDSGVTFDDFVEAHGLAPILFNVTGEDDETVVNISTETVYKNPYDKVDWEKTISSEIKKEYGSARGLAEELAREIVQNHLISSGYSLKISPSRNIICSTDKFRYLADFVYDTDAHKDIGLSKWAFDVRIGKKRPLMHKLSWMFGASYVDSIRDNGIKLTLVITDADDFYDTKEILASMKILDDISIMLIDLNERKVIEEYDIPKRF